MIKKCPNCGNTILGKISSDNVQEGLIKVDMNYNPPKIHADSVIPVDTYVCKDCGFVMLYSEKLASLVKKHH